MDFKEMARELVLNHLMSHPLPWHIESSWTKEVTASDGYLIAKTDHQTAVDVIALAESIQKEMNEFMVQFNKEMEEEWKNDK